jgi:dihydropyrimidinase
MATILIRGGTVVTATGRGAADVLVDGEKIAAVLLPGSTLLGVDLASAVDTVVEAAGKYVIPGGIDAHTHMSMPFGGTTASDDFETGTRAAAWGGTTTIIDFAVQKYGERLEDGGGSVCGGLFLSSDCGRCQRCLADGAAPIG